jgi:hypothetical protein
MRGQENAITFIGGKMQAVGRGPFPTADAGRGVRRRTKIPVPFLVSLQESSCIKLR